MAPNPVRIADETLAQGPLCSPDGKWVVYLRGPGWFPMRVPIGGEKPAQMVAQDPVAAVPIFEPDLTAPIQISPDGKLVAYLMWSNPGVALASVRFKTPGSESNPSRWWSTCASVRLACFGWTPALGHEGRCFAIRINQERRLQPLGTETHRRAAEADYEL